MLRAGQRVAPTDEFKRTFPKANVARGTVVARNRKYPDVYTVQWDNKRSVERLHLDFLEVAKD